MKLEHIAPYLPYGLKGMVKLTMFNPRIEKMVTIVGVRYYRTHLPEPNELWQVMESNGSFDSLQGEYIKPILRPLSDLTREITHNGETFVPIDSLKEYYNSLPDSFVEKLLFVEWDGQFTLFGLEEDPLEVSMPYSMYQKVFEWHFDVFGLIESGEAIDINTFKS